MRGNVAIVLIELIAVLTASCGKREEVSAEKRPTITGVKIEAVQLAPVADDYEAVGTVRSKTTSTLSSKVVGTIIAVRVHEGERVRAGQLLIEIDSRDAQAQVQKAQAGWREAQDALGEVERTLRAAESAKLAAEAHRALATSTYQRYQTLLERRSVSPQEFDDVEAKYKAARAEADRANETGASLLAKKGQVLAKIDQAKADMAYAQIYAGYARILSPIQGIVTAKPADLGAMAAPGVPLLTVEDDAHYRLEAAVAESLIGKIHLGDSARVRIDALGPLELDGRVAEVVPASDPTSRSYTVKIDLVAEGGAAPPAPRSGLFGKARFIIGQRQAITIPQKAIRPSGQLTGVYVVDPSSTARLRLIQTGKQYGDRVEALSGINAGDRIIVAGLDAVRDGSPVK